MEEQAEHLDVEVNGIAGEVNTETSVPCASIIWLARAVNVVRPVARRLHIDRARFAGKDGA